MELQEQKKLLKKVKDEAESELEASLRREEAAQRREEAALREKEAAAAQLDVERKAKEEATAQLDVERKAKLVNAKAVARLNAEKEDAIAQLLREKDEAVRKLQTVVAEINSDTTLQARRRRVDATATSIEPFDRDNPGVKKVGGNVLVKSTTTNTCSFNVDIHEGLEELLEALFNDQTKVDKTLFQQVIEEGVVYWSFMVNNTKSCDLLLRMRVERQEEAGAVIRVESVEEEGESGDEG